MRTHDGRINHLQCRVGQAAAGERLQHHIPDATVSPAAELPKNRIPVAELLRQIAPRRAGPHQPKRRVHHTAMVARRTASATDQKRFEIRPLIIGQQSANQGCPPQRAALNQFSIPASIDLSTRPSPDISHHSCMIEQVCATICSVFCRRAALWRRMTRDSLGLFRGCGCSEDEVSVGL